MGWGWRASCNILGGIHAIYFFLIFIVEVIFLIFKEIVFPKETFFNFFTNRTRENILLNTPWYWVKIKVSNNNNLFVLCDWSIKKYMSSFAEATQMHQRNIDFIDFSSIKCLNDILFLFNKYFINTYIYVL